MVREIMISIELEPNELKVLQDVLESAYRAQHREVFETQSARDPSYAAEAKRKQEVIAVLLGKCGSAPGIAMRSLG